MTTATFQKIEYEVKMLKKKVYFLEKAMSAPTDQEGDYNPLFVKKILKRTSVKTKKIYEYKKSGDLLQQLSSLRGA